MLFVDLVGYSSLTEGWDAEDVRGLLAGYFEVAHTVVQRYGGSVEKFIGDAVVAVWGSEGARADDAERAVRAALDIVEAVPGYGRDRGSAALSARAGVVTGQVSSWSSQSGLVAGDRVNLAARVQSMAQPGSVLVDEVTMGATRTVVAYSDAGRHELKGFSEPVPLWSATRVLGKVGTGHRVDGLEAGFMGRSRELTLVKELFHAAVEGHRLRLVAVLGVAGIGKSRLGWELEKYVDGLANVVLWHRGRCPSYGDGVAFWALAEMVRARLRILEQDTTEAVAAKVSEGVERWVPDVEERRFVEPRLGVLVGAEDKEFSTEELFAGWRLFVERLAAVEPVILLFEDLQWADSGLLDFIEYLLDWSTSSPIYVVCLARPELLEQSQGWLADRSNATLLRLEPLSEALIGQLLSALVPDMPEHVQGRIAAQAGGIPLYAVETVRALVDRGLVEVRNGAYCMAGAVDDLEVPASLTSLIAARLDGLPAPERDLAKGLSVLGDSFQRHAVPAVSEMPAAQLDLLLQALVRKEILTVRADPLEAEQSQYAFLQGMLRSVAYDAITREERKARHQAVARHLSSTMPDDGAEVIAAHLLDAYRAAGNNGESAQLRVDAAKAFERAGTRAGKLGSPDAAEKHFRTAAELSVSEADQARYTQDAAWMAHRAGRSQDALALLETATDTHRAAGRELEAAQLASSTGWIYLNLGQPEAALECLQPAVAMLERAQDDAAAHLYAPLASALIMIGDSGAASQYLERALASGTALAEPDALMAGLHTKAVLLATEHRHVEAEALLLAVVKVAHEEDDPEFEARARGSLGWLRSQGDESGASEQLERSLDLWRRLGERAGQAECTHDLAFFHFYAGHWDEAERYAQKTMDLFPRFGESGRHPGLPLLLILAARGFLREAEQQLHSMAEIALLTEPEHRAAMGIARAVVGLGYGHPDAALDAASTATQEIMSLQGIRSHLVRLGWPLAMQTALQSARIDQAESLLALVAKAPKGHVPPYLRAQLTRNQALLTMAKGEDTEVDAALGHSIDAFGRLGYPYWRARAQADLGTWLLETGRAPEGEQLITAAAETFSALGAQPDLEHLPTRISQ